jgi:hypothetical protein
MARSHRVPDFREDQNTSGKLGGYQESTERTRDLWLDRMELSPAITLLRDGQSCRPQMKCGCGIVGSNGNLGGY